LFTRQRINVRAVDRRVQVQLQLQFQLLLQLLVQLLVQLHIILSLFGIILQTFGRFVLDLFEIGEQMLLHKVM
jgi:hypothetical protein